MDFESSISNALMTDLSSSVELNKRIPVAASGVRYGVMPAPSSNILFHNKADILTLVKDICSLGRPILCCWSNILFSLSPNPAKNLFNYGRIMFCIKHPNWTEIIVHKDLNWSWYPTTNMFFSKANKQHGNRHSNNRSDLNSPLQVRFWTNEKFNFN